MDCYRLFNERCPTEGKKRRQRQQTKDRAGPLVMEPSLDSVEIMFPECFVVKGVYSSSKCLPNRSREVYTSNATRRMFQRLAGSRANTAQPNSRSHVSRASTRKQPIENQQFERQDLPLTDSLPCSPLLKLPQVLLSTILANGILFQMEGKPIAFISRSCRCAMKQAFERRSWWSIECNSRSLPTANLYIGPRKTSKLVAMTGQCQYTRLDIQNRRLITEQLQGTAAVLLPSSYQAAKQANSGQILNPVGDAIVRLPVVTEAPRMQNHLPNSQSILNFRKILDALKPEFPMGEYLLYESQQPPIEFTQKLLMLGCRKLLVRYCGVQQLFQRSAVLPKSEKTICELLKRVRKHQPLIFQALPDPLISDCYSLQLSSYLLVVMVSGAVRAYLYDDHVLRKKVIETSQLGSRSAGTGRVKEMRLDEATDILTRDDYLTIRNKLRELSALIVANSSGSHQHHHLSFQLFELGTYLTDKLQPFLLHITANPVLDFRSSRLRHLQHQLTENIIKLAVDPIFPPPTNHPFAHQPNNFQLVFDSTFHSHHPPFHSHPTSCD